MNILKRLILGLFGTKTIVIKREDFISGNAALEDVSNQPYCEPGVVPDHLISYVLFFVPFSHWHDIKPKKVIVPRTLIEFLAKDNGPELLEKVVCANSAIKSGYLRGKRSSVEFV